VAANPSAKATGNGTATATNGTSGMMAIYSRHWGPERSVVILRDPAKSLGISIVGGKVNQQKENVLKFDDDFYNNFSKFDSGKPRPTTTTTNRSM
jgi:hypothetical protein